MAIVLGPNRYGKAEIRLLHVSRDDSTHVITDLNVSVALSGELTATHLSGDNSAVLTTDAQKNTVFAFAKEHGIGEIEDFALRLARHFVASQAAITFARVYRRAVPVGTARRPFLLPVRPGGPHRDRQPRRHRLLDGLRAARPDPAELGRVGVLGVRQGPLHHAGRDDRPDPRHRGERAVAARQPRYPSPGGESPGARARDAMLEAFAGTHSYSLQQTLFAMGQRVLDTRPEIAEIRLSLPNKHHFEVDMSPFGLVNGGEVFYASDRPYGLIEGTILRDDAPPPGKAW